MSEISADRDEMLAAVKVAASIVEGRSTIPIMANLLLRASGDQAMVAGTNLDLWASVRFAAKGDMATTLPATALISALGGLRTGVVRLKLDGGRAVLTQGRSRRTIPVLPADDFPMIRPTEQAVRQEVPAAVLARLLATTAFAAGAEPTCIYLNGVFLHTVNGELRAASTDGHRLSRTTCDVAAADGLPAMILSTKTVKLLRVLLADAEGGIVLHCDESRIMATVGDTEVIAKLIEGTFPDYTRVIPPIGPNSLTVQASELRRAVASVAGMAEGKVRALALELRDEPEITTKSTEAGAADEPIDGAWTGTPMRVGANGRYLADFANLFAETSSVVLAFNDPRAPILITSEAEPDLTGVLMPMNA